MNKLPLFQKGRSGGIQFDRDNNYTSEIVLFGYFLFVIVFLVVLALRLFQLTIVKGEYYRGLSEQNRIKELLIEAPRGEIIDRKRFVIAQNTLPDINLNKDRITSGRIYQTPLPIAPLIGYRQLADPHDLQQDNCLQKLKSGDKVGKKGVESLYECQLRGTAGKKLVEIDAKGKYLHTLTVLPPKAGETIQLAFDWQLQQKTYELIKDKKAAVVGVSPKTGEILVFAASPSFNPQFFEDGKTVDASRYFTDEAKPLFNRATEATYPPGSLFKLVVATAALEEKAITNETLFEDTGTISAGPLKFGNWYFLEYGKTEGMVDIVKAIQRSNDIFFYKAGEAAGVDKIKKWADILGLGKKTNIGFDEAVGLIPSPFWKAETIKDRWYLGDTYNMSIGQGYLGVTPIQMAMLTAVFANGGYLCQPQLLKIQNSESRIQNCKKLPISDKTLGLIREGMKAACTTGGTGWPLFDFKIAIPIQPTRLYEASRSAAFQPIQTACKTGTAESSQTGSSVPHAWITVFAPYDNPEIVLTILVEEAGQGSDIAGPIARDILKAFFERSE